MTTLEFLILMDCQEVPPLHYLPLKKMVKDDDFD